MVSPLGGDFGTSNEIGYILRTSEQIKRSVGNWSTSLSSMPTSSQTIR